MASSKSAHAYSALPSTIVVSSRKSILVYAGVLLCSYFLFMIITLPAYWADWLLSRVGSGMVRIQEAEGTLWNGSGNLVIQSVGRKQFQSRISWKLQYLHLLSGKIQTRLSTSSDVLAFNATVRAGYHNLSIQDVDTTLPLSILNPFIPALDLVAPSGRLKITTSKATFTPDGLDGDIQLIWLNAGARMGGLSDAGEYRLVINGLGATAGLRIDTLRGDITVTAQGEWQTQGTGPIQLTGDIAPGNREQYLRPLLTMINAQNKNGRYGWTFNTHFPVTRFFETIP